MAITYDLSIGEVAKIDPGDAGGPYTIRFPDVSRNGVTASIKDEAGDTTNITLDALGTSTTVEDPTTPGTFSATVTLSFTNISCVTYMYDAGDDVWFVLHTAAFPDA